MENKNLLTLPTYPHHKVPHFTSEQCRDIDKKCMTTYNIDVIQLMECAGYQTAYFTRLFLENCKDKHVIIVIGKGHNGGDGLVCAKHLSNWGAQVTVILSGGPLKGVVLAHFNRCKHLHIKIVEVENMDKIPPILKSCHVIIDALLGVGLQDPPRQEQAHLISTINGSHKPIISLDCPSGFNSTTGEAFSPCIKAIYTVTLGVSKAGFSHNTSSAYCGNIILADIGIPKDIYDKLHPSYPNLFEKSSLINLVY